MWFQPSHPGPGSPVAQSTPAAPRQTLILGLSSATVFVVLVNTTAINSALNAIAGDLTIGSVELGWMVAIYMLACAAFVIPSGRLGDVLGIRKLTLGGLLVYIAGSIAVALAAAGWLLIAGRFLQGAGAAALMPASMAMLRHAFPAERQGYALGIWGAIAGLGFAFGPLIGGVVTDVFGWRWLWWGSAVAASALALVALTSLRGMPRLAERPRIDAAGAVLLALGMFVFILGIQQARVWGWGSPATIGALGASVVILAALVMVEQRREQPMLHLGLLRNRVLVAATLAIFVDALVMIPILFFFNLYAQAVVTLDYSAIEASLALLPFGLTTFVTSLVIGRVCDRVGFRAPIAVGFVVTAAGCLLLGQVNAESGYGSIWWTLAILGVGIGITFSSPGAAGLRSVDADSAGEAAGIINSARYLAAALSIAIGTAVFTAVGSAHLNRSLERANVPALEQRALDTTLTGSPVHFEAAEKGIGQGERTALRAGAAEGISAGFATLMIGLGLASLLTVLPWLWLMRPRRARSPVT
jgi:EmrB/QacA subfamily drug resistance transporter